jgi:hypothetical protein
MAAPATFYLEQAEICARSAAATLLGNQRETFLRSRAAWLALAARDIEVQAGRAAREQARQLETSDDRPSDPSLPDQPGH